MDRLGPIILVAGLGCFLLAFVLSGWYPYAITDSRHVEASLEEVARDVPDDFKDLKAAYPVAFGGTFPGSEPALTLEQAAGIPLDDPRMLASDDAWRDAYARALRTGRDVYVAEGCWHCHSQYVRPVANEAQRFGPVRLSDHDNNALQRPQLWGTRRVGPDLTHEGRLRSNDWHVAHLYDPQATTPGSVMPAYTWLFREGWQVRRVIDPDTADRAGIDPSRSYGYPGVYDTEEEAEAAMEELRERLTGNLADEAERLFVEPAEGPDGDALSLVAYLQWLGTWSPSHLEQAP